MINIRLAGLIKYPALPDDPTGGTRQFTEVFPGQDIAVVVAVLRAQVAKDAGETSVRNVLIQEHFPPGRFDEQIRTAGTLIGYSAIMGGALPAAKASRQAW
jgi:hypothetical protein